MHRSRFLRMVRKLAAALTLLSASAWGATFKVIYTFVGSNNGFQDGANPIDTGDSIRGLLFDFDTGSLYGTTAFGGSCGLGTIFELSPDGKGGWNETVLHSFCGNDGAHPFGGLPPGSQLGPMGSFSSYGTTAFGGPSGCGSLFRFLSSTYFSDRNACGGAFGNNTTPLSRTTGPFPAPGSTTDYRTAWTYYEGGNNGAGAINTGFGLYQFCSLAGCVDGASPGGGLATIEDSQSDLEYGMTYLGGAFGKGVLYQIAVVPDPNNPGNYSFSESVLHSFAGGVSDGAYPIFAAPTAVQNCLQNVCESTIWGTTPYGGANGARIGGYGTVFNVDTSTLSFNLVHSFNYLDGAYPYSTLMHFNNIFYGTTSEGGVLSVRCCPIRLQTGSGTIYSLTPDGTLTTLHTFSGPDGADPLSGLTADGNGNLYGVTYLGGAYNVGVVYEITP